MTSPAPTPSTPVATGLSYAVDIVFCIDVTGSMSPIIDAVKTANETECPTVVLPARDRRPGSCSGSGSWNLDADRTAAELHSVVHDALNERLTGLQAPPSGLRSRLLRALPTTMALLALQRLESGGPDWYCHVFWAGDSRAYVLEPGSGVRQLTVDDIKDKGDAIANLRQDSVVSNAMSADIEFEVHHRRIQLTALFLVMTATDGCFGYVRSPMHFEQLVLSTMRDAADTGSWSAALQARISAVTGDDAAMAVLGLGADHDGFQQLFVDRTRAVEETWVGPLDILAEEVQQADRALTAARSAYATGSGDLWASYKPAYEHYVTQHQASEEEQVMP